MYIVNHILLIEFINLRRFIVAITHVSLLLVTIHNHTKTSKRIQKISTAKNKSRNQKSREKTTLTPKIQILITN